MQILMSFNPEQKHVTQIIRISKMATLEQRSVIKFCVVNKKNQERKCSKCKTAFGNNVLKETVLVPWDFFLFPLIKIIL